VPVLVEGSSEPIEQVYIKLRYQIAPEFLDSESQSILPVSQIRCLIKDKSYDYPMRNINGRWGVKRTTVKCIQTLNKTISLGNVLYVLNFFPTEYQIVTQESVNRVTTKLREIHLSRLLTS
jgi:hypothetical protein